MVGDIELSRARGVHLIETPYGTVLSGLWTTFWVPSQPGDTCSYHFSRRGLPVTAWGPLQGIPYQLCVGTLHLNLNKEKGQVSNRWLPTTGKETQGKGARCASRYPSSGVAF